MLPAPRRFRPPLLPTLAAALFLVLLTSLGFWQLDRARQKQALQQHYEDRGRAPVVDLATAARRDEGEMHWRRVRLEGRYDPVRHFLLDNQVYRGRAGYLVYTPFLLAGEGVRVLVNRGWVAAGPDRSQGPGIRTPQGETELRGVAKPVPRTPVLSETPPEALGQDLVRVQAILPAQIAGRENWTLLPYEVRLETPASGFVRDWPAPGTGRERHLGYAFQWFALAALLVVIYVVLVVRAARGASDHAG